MGRTIGITSHLGGVGKTVTTLNIGMSLASMGHSVLLLDGDPLAGLSLAAGQGRRTDRGLYQYLQGSHSLEEIIHTAKDSGLALVRTGVSEPAHIFALEQRAAWEKLWQAVRQLADRYDYVLIDTACGQSSLTTLLLGSADAVVMPLPCRTLAVKSLPLFLQFLLRLRQTIQPDLRFAGAIFSMVDSLNPYEMDIIADLRQSFPASTFFSTVIPLDRAFEKAAAHGVPVGIFREYDDLARGYTDLATELVQRDRKLQNKGGSSEQPDPLF